VWLSDTRDLVKNPISKSPQTEIEKLVSFIMHQHSKAMQCMSHADIAAKEMNASSSSQCHVLT